MLREAVQACQAADTASAGSPLHALCLTNLGSALQMLAGQAGDIGVVERAVAAHRAAVAGTLAGDPYLARRMANLGSALETLSGWTGDVGPRREASGARSPPLRPASPAGLITCPVSGRPCKGCSRPPWKPGP